MYLCLVGRKLGTQNRNDSTDMPLTNHKEHNIFKSPGNAVHSNANFSLKVSGVHYENDMDDYNLVDGFILSLNGC